MSLNHSKITLNAGSYTLISDPASDNDMYKRDIAISIQNLHSTHYVFVGSEEVSSTSFGYRISPGDSFSISNLRPDDEIYASTDSGTTDISVIKVIH